MLFKQSKKKSTILYSRFFFDCLKAVKIGIFYLFKLFGNTMFMILKIA